MEATITAPTPITTCSHTPHPLTSAPSPPTITVYPHIHITTDPTHPITSLPIHTTVYSRHERFMPLQTTVRIGPIGSPLGATLYFATVHDALAFTNRLGKSIEAALWETCRRDSGEDASNG